MAPRKRVKETEEKNGKASLNKRPPKRARKGQDEAKKGASAEASRPTLNREGPKVAKV